jgi:ATP-binding cassette subfamily C protein CydC
MGEFLRLVLTRPWSAAAGFGASLVSTVSSVSLMATAGWFISAMAQAGAAGVLLNILIPSALIRLLAVSRTGMRYVDRLTLHNAAFKIIGQLRLALFSKILALPWEESSTMKDSWLEHALRKDTGVLENAYIKQLVPMACAFASGALFGLAAALCAGAGPALMLLLLMAASGAVVPALISLVSRRIDLMARPLRSRLFALSHDLSCGLLDLCALNEAGAMQRKIEKLSEGIATAAARSELLQGIALAGAKAAAMGAMLLAFSVCAPLALDGAISGPVYVMLGIAAMAAYEVVLPLAQAFFGFPEVSAASASICSLENAGSGLDEQGGKAVSGVGEIRFDHACASLGGREVLHDLNFSLDSGENILVKGPVGSGKSTLFLLMQRLISPSSGRVLADGEDVSGISASSLRRAMPMALQDPQLFSGSVRDVFDMVRPGIEDSEIRRILSIVELDSFLDSLPEGLSQWLGPAGRALSGGEARRLCIARALCAAEGSRGFLILDEPGEGLEPDQARRILKRIASSRRGVIVSLHDEDCPDGFDCIVTVGGGSARKDSTTTSCAGGAA